MIEQHLTFDCTVQEPNGPSYQADDQIWYVISEGVVVVTKIITHDGITWETGQKCIKHPYEVPTL